MAESVTITASGSLFDGSAQLYLDAFMAQAAETVAKDMTSEVMFTQQTDFKEPTGAFWRSMTDVPTMIPEGYQRVVSSTAVYAPWLEGVEARNQTSRFKGYGSFRRGFEAAKQAIPRILESVGRQTLGKMS